MEDSHVLVRVEDQDSPLPDDIEEARRLEHADRHYNEPKAECWDCMAESWITPEAYQQAAYGGRYRAGLDINVSGRRMDDWRERLEKDPQFCKHEAIYIARDLGYGEMWPAVAATYYFPREAKKVR